MPAIPVPTVAQLFDQLGLIEWWKLGEVTQSFGENGEKGTDYSLGAMGKPVGSITGGKVVYVGNGGYAGSSIGQIVQVLNSDGSLVHYQHLKSSSVSLGQSVHVGDVIGTGGGCPVGAYYADPNRNDCQFYDSFSSGQHIEVRYSPSYSQAGGVWSQNWIDPRQVFLGIAARNPGTSTNSQVNPPSSSQDNGGTGNAGGLPSIDFSSIGVKIGVFLLALAFIGGGFYMLFSDQINAAVGDTAKVAAKAALA